MRDQVRLQRLVQRVVAHGHRGGEPLPVPHQQPVAGERGVPRRPVAVPGPEVERRCRRAPSRRAAARSVSVAAAGVSAAAPRCGRSGPPSRGSGRAGRRRCGRCRATSSCAAHDLLPGRPGPAVADRERGLDQQFQAVPLPAVQHRGHGRPGSVRRRQASRRAVGLVPDEPAGERVDADLDVGDACGPAASSTCRTGLRFARGAPRCMLTTTSVPSTAARWCTRSTPPRRRPARSTTRTRSRSSERRPARAPAPAVSPPASEPGGPAAAHAVATDGGAAARRGPAARAAAAGAAGQQQELRDAASAVGRPGADVELAAASGHSSRPTSCRCVIAVVGHAPPFRIVDGDAMSAAPVGPAPRRARRCVAPEQRERQEGDHQRHGQGVVDEHEEQRQGQRERARRPPIGLRSRR